LKRSDKNCHKKGSSHKQLFEKQLESGLLTDVKCTEPAEIRHVFVL